MTTKSSLSLFLYHPSQWFVRHRFASHLLTNIFPTTRCHASHSPFKTSGLEFDCISFLFGTNKAGGAATFPANNNFA